MLPYLCDTPDRLTSRIYTTLRVDCDCCTFWRGVSLGFVAGCVITGMAILLVAAVLAAVLLLL